ncbi:expressed unknown protein [Seminavis robusta]|uniref:TLC domain-containing protein n=1 Tax=Seminavis robusta TaxID=568900 RepID=A0A9N8EGD8_9STRA|nr:expressed unknown protein [Seminavis robusta]|eukprot:Sro1056_g236210.1 n/a (281) ;mRNA; r:32933-33775
MASLEQVFGSSHVDTGSWEKVVENCVKPVLCYIPLLLACYFMTLFALQQVTDWKGLKLQRIAGQLSMYPSFLVLIFTSHVATLDSDFWGWDGNARFQSSSYWCDLFANMYIAVNLVQAMGQIQTEKPPLLYQLMAHHVFSVFCYSSGFYFDRFRWWTTLAGCCELTNLFLVPVFLSKDYFPEWRKERWFLYSSRLLLFTFLTHRMVLFPIWLGLWFWDRIHADPSVPIHWVEGTFYPVTILGLFLLSIMWLVQIHRGLEKQTRIYLQAQEERQKSSSKRD